MYRTMTMAMMRNIKEEIKGLFTSLVEEDGKTLQRADLVEVRSAALAQWLTGEGWGMILAGRIGTGKTTYCNAVARALRGVRHRPYTLPVAVVTAAQVVRASVEDPNYYMLLSMASVLVIDDLGTEAVTVQSWGNVSSPVVEMINERYRLRNRPTGCDLLQRPKTLLTTNLPKAERGKRYGERVMDRLGECARLVFKENSYRQQKETI